MFLVGVILLIYSVFRLILEQGACAARSLHFKNKELCNMI